MADIEDLMLSNATITTQETARPDKIAAIKKNFARNKQKNRPYDEKALQEQTESVGIVPGSQKIYVKTFGCSHNISDSEFMMGQLVDYGYELTEDPFVADLILINSCTVKNPSQEALMRMVFDTKEIKKPVVVSGCVPQGDKFIDGLQDVSIIGITQIDRVVEVVEETLKGHTVQLLEKKDLPQLDLPKIRKNKFIEILAVNTGCLGNCTYCKTKHARGHLGSYHPDEIIRRALKACEEGAREIWLTSEDTGAYGRDIGTNIAELLIKLTEVLPEYAMLRIGMTNPPYILEHMKTITRVMNHPRVFGFLHLPVQSGSNTVLERMNREYTCEEFNSVVDCLLSEVKEISIGTDIICGFPGETDFEHKETMALLEKYKFPFVNISQFYPRPGTIAARMKQVNTKDKKDRSRQVTELFNGYRNTQKKMNVIERVWISEKEVLKGEQILVGHTKDYTKVTLPFDETLLGSCVMVKITECKKWHVEGEIVDRNPGFEHVPKNYFDDLRGAPEDTEAEFLKQASNLDELPVTDRKETTTGINALIHGSKVGALKDDKYAYVLVAALFLFIVGLMLKASGL